MDTMDSEKEQLAQIKKWIQENGLSLVMGIVLGLGGVYGWRAWEAHQIKLAEDASASLAAVSDKIATAQYEAAAGEVSGFLAEQDGNLYADMARLLLARARVEQGKVEDAVAPLQQVVDRGSNSVFSALAAQRLARVYLQLQQYDEAEKTLTIPVPKTFKPAFEELRGDIAYARGDHAAALGSYRQAAILAGDENPLLQMKLDDLAANTAE